MGKKKDVRMPGKSGSPGSVSVNTTEGITLDDLTKMKNMDIREAERDTLADILEIEIDKDLSDAEKKREFIRQIRNPYLYRQGEYIVKLSFTDTDATLADRLKEYIEHMAAAGL